MLLIPTGLSGSEGRYKHSSKYDFSAYWGMHSWKEGKNFLKQDDHSYTLCMSVYIFAYIFIYIHSYIHIYIYE